MMNEDKTQADDDESFGQVFDSTIDFVRNVELTENDQNTCDMNTAFQISTVTTDIAAAPSHSHSTYSSSNELANNISMQNNSSSILIPYDKSLIKIEKNKKKSRPFCSGPPKKTSNLRSLSPPPASEASDISSVISLNSISSISGDNIPLSPIIMNGGANNLMLELPAEVHGMVARNPSLDAQVQMKKLSKKLEFLQSENDHYAKLVKEIPNAKEELSQLKNVHFQLQRENAGLRSQLESIFENMKEEAKSSFPFENDKIEPLICDHATVLSETKSELRQAQDETSQMKNQITKLKLDLKSRDDDLKRHEAQHEALENHNLEMSASNQKLMQKTREIEAEFSSSVRSKLVAEQSLGILQGERETLVKSRNWYRDQMHSAQESKSLLQQTLINTQSDLANKVNQIEQLKIEMLQNGKTLEEERKKSLHEKETLKAQLEEFINLGLSQQLGEQENDDDIGLKDEINELKIQLEVCKDEIRGCESRNEILTKKLKEAVEENEIVVQQKMKEFEEHKLQNLNLKTKLEEVENSEKMYIDELAAKNNVIECLKEEKLNVEMTVNRLKIELDESRQSYFQQMDLNKDQKMLEKSMKDKIVRKQTELDHVELELKHFKNESSKARAEIEQFKLTQNEDLDIKKQLLKEISEYQNEIRNLKDAFAAADEARQELETALEHIKHKQTADDSNFQSALIDSKQEILQLEQKLHEKSVKLNDFELSNHDLNQELDDLKIQLKTLREVHEEVINNDFKTENLSSISQSLSCSNSPYRRDQYFVYESEIQQLKAKVENLEEQVLHLEHKNGKLIQDSRHNSSLKHQIQKLQEEILKDTNLRKELLSSLELAKSSLHTEIRNLEKGLKEEKRGHCETKNRLILQEHECANLRVDRRSLRTGLETANLTIDKLNKQIQDGNTGKGNRHHAGPDLVSLIDPGDYQILNEKFKDTHKTLEESERIINGLKDQITELRFQLTQKQSEITSLQHQLKTKEESCHFETNELRSKCDNLRMEIVNLSKKVDKLSEEKNQYRAQVQDMNVALKNSLEHIKRLRTQSSTSLEELGQEVEQNDALGHSQENNQEIAVKKPNLTNLTNCLSTLKYEMAILQKKLAPSTSSSPVRTIKMHNISSEFTTRATTDES